MKQSSLFAIPHLKAVSVREAEVADHHCNDPEKFPTVWRETVEADPIFDPEKEHFAVFFLNRRNKLRGFNIVSIGTLHGALVEPREVFRPAIAVAASSIIIAHNHPSGDPSPSTADIQVTRKLKEAGELLHIPVRDHVIIGRKEHDPNEIGYYSFHEAGLV